MDKLSETIRKNAFWFKDSLKGGYVRNNLGEVKLVLEGRANSEISNNQQKKLIDHAIKTTEYYNNINNATSLNDFPVVNKNIIRGRFDSFISKSIPSQERIPVVTSGSTGTPFKVFHDKQKKIRNNADTLYLAHKTGYDIGQRLIYMKIWAKQKMASPLQYWTQNMVPVDVIQLADLQISGLIEGMESYNGTHSMLGYVSAMEEVCKYLDRIGKNQVQAKVASIITMSETLNEYTKTGMEKYFGACVYSRYSNLENGIIAQQVPGSGHRYLVNTASYHLEILNMENNEPAPKGQMGRIVVTDLFNLAMPMIRYDTGDIGAFSNYSDDYENLYLDKVEGRKLDLLYDTKGNLVSSYIVYKNMWQYTEINQYQLIQETEKDYQFKISLNGHFNKERQLIEEFKQFLGQDANFEITYVDEIPLLDSGKRRKIVNNYKKQEGI